MATKLNTSTSIVDKLKSEGKDSSFAARKALAESQGIKNYTGTAAQNTALLGGSSSKTTSGGGSSSSSSGSGGSNSSGSARVVTGGSNPNNLTTEQVIAFQKANGLVPDGIIGPKTQAKFNETKYNTTPIIAVPDVTKETKPFPEKEADTYNYDALLSVEENQKNYDELAKKELDKNLKYIKNNLYPESGVDAYAQMEEDANIARKEKAVSEIEAKIKGITTRAEAQKLSLVGQGRGIPEAIIGGQQAQIAREAAIEVLPLTAVQAAAQADLQYAQDRVDKMFQIKMNDIDRQANYEAKVFDYLKDYSDSKMKRLLDDIQTNKQMEYAQQKADIEKIKDYAYDVASNGASASVINAVYNAKTLKEALVAGKSYIAEPSTTKPKSQTAINLGFSNFLRTGKTPAGEKIGNPMGADGYVDPGVYKVAFENWEGSTKDFLSEFPIKQYVNPLSYGLLPEALQATITTTKSNTSSSLSSKREL